MIQKDDHMNHRIHLDFYKNKESDDEVKMKTINHSKAPSLKGPIKARNLNMQNEINNYCDKETKEF